MTKRTGIGVIPVRSYLCASSGEGCQQRRHIRGFRKKFEKQLLFGRCVKTLKRIGCRGLLLPGKGAVAQSHPPEEVALHGQHPDHDLPVPDGPLLYPGGADEIVQEIDEIDFG